ncbi:hypothetical protein BDP27DRAFT_1483659 [Rhodocollybia butyracea]|uniref:Uncharacterized protein n=1 Tax=Rhodocollybia butyracea TaxID=206335 RepID=A0A9P5Q394_9AGAR|nr:hypothetical protein BDP27DRAFT_1483659 [Rhodocollybia butyracea]
MIWAAAVAIQRKLSPHLLAMANDKSYQPGKETRAVRLAFSILTPRLIFLRTHVLGWQSCPLIIESIVASCQRLSRIVRRTETSPSAEPAWYLADHMVQEILEYANLHFHLPNCPISIPLDKDCQETDWLGDQEPIDTGGEEEVEEASDAPSDSERSTYEEPPSHSRVGVSGWRETFSLPDPEIEGRRKSKVPPAPPPAVVSDKKTKKAPAPAIVPKASKEVKTPSVPKASKAPKVSTDIKVTRSLKSQGTPLLEAPAAGSSKSKNKVKDVKGKGKEVISDPVMVRFY